MVEFFAGVTNVIGSILLYGFLYVLLPLGALSFLWPYLSGIIKLFGLLIPVAVVFLIFRQQEFWLGVLAVAGSVVWYAIGFLITRLLDDTFGTLGDENEFWT